MTDAKQDHSLLLSFVAFREDGIRTLNGVGFDEDDAVG